MPPVPVARDRQGLLDDRCDSASIDVLHGEHVRAGGAKDLLLARVEIAYPDEHGVLRSDLRREAADARQFRGLGPEQRRQRHAVDVAAVRRGRRVDVAVRVDPDQSERFVFAPHELRGRRDRSRGEAVIAAEHDRQRALLQGGERRLVQLFADARDFADVLLLRIAERLDFRDGRDEVAFVDDGHSERGEPLRQSGDAKRGRSHVDAAPVAAEVERDADQVNRLGTHPPETLLQPVRPLRLTIKVNIR